MFDFELKLKNTHALVIFSGQLEGDDGYYGDEIDKILKKKNTLFSDIIFLFPKYIENKICDFLRPDSKLESNLTRAKNVNQISLVTFDGYADLELYTTLMSPSNLTLNFDNNVKQALIEAGLLSLVEGRKEKIILQAPPGTTFEKPSKKRFAEFIKTAELAVGFSQTQFVAFALLSRRPKRTNKHKIKHIWIDTSSVSQFVEALIYYIYKFNGDNYRTLQYHSFQSYGDDKTAGYKVHTPDIVDDIWVIISASRSNDMGVDIYKVWAGIKHDQIVTILSYTNSVRDLEYLAGSSTKNSEFPARPGDDIAVNISEFSDHHSIEKKHGSEVRVKIIGENFTAQVEAPNSVLVRQVHGPNEIQKFVEPINQADIILTNKKHLNRLRSIFFDFVKFRKTESKLNNDYLAWLKDIVDWYIPRSICAIIYDMNDDASKFLAKDINSCLNFTNISPIDMKGDIEIDPEGAIIALLPVINRGNGFVKLNSDLRLANHSAQRIFIAPFALAHTKADFNALSNSLSFGPRGLKYQFLNFRKIFIGHQEPKNSWEREREVVEQFTAPVWAARKNILREQSKGILNAVGACCLRSDSNLRFSKDFAFWKSEYLPEKVNSAAVYLTVSSILQNLREKPYSLIDKDALFTHVFQHSVLDPSNFSRFNDSLLQSCLWRCAYDGELDYRSADDLSRRFCDILKRMAVCQAKGEPNATLDLLVGVAIMKIQISKECLQEMVIFLKQTLKGISEFEDILEYISHNFKLPNIDETEF